MNLNDRIFILISLLIVFGSCAPKLTFSEVKEKIEKNYIAFNENDIEYEFNNAPVKFLKEYGKKGYHENLYDLKERRENDELRPRFGDIGELKIQDLDRCNSIYFYKATYTIDKAQMTPYLDSVALERNYKNYGNRNVSFNPNTNILQIREKKESILIFDSDKEWKLLNYTDLDEELYDRLFGDGFSNCLIQKVETSEYLPYR